MTALSAIETAEREARIVELRAQRKPWREIATEVGVSHQRCQQIYRRCLDRIPAARVDQHRAEEVEMADHAVGTLWGIVLAQKTSDANKIKALDVMVKWSERKARMIGIDAAQRREVEYSDSSIWEAEMRQRIAQTEMELRQRRAITVDAEVIE